jgi:hypothetical protein
MRSLILFSSILFFFSSCQDNKLEKVKSEINLYHDSCMALTSKIPKYSVLMRSDSMIISIEQLAKNVGIADSLELAYNGMFDWMKNYDIEFDVKNNKAKSEEYYNKQLAEIQVITRLTVQSLQEAKSSLKE